MKQGFMFSYLISLLSSFTDFLYPPFCLVCKEDTSGDGSKYICESCLDQIKEINPPFCAKCGRGFVSKNALEGIEKPVCGKCQNKGNRIRYDAILGLGEYAGTLKEIIHIYKYNKKEQLKDILSEIMIKRINGEPEFLKADVLIPVPLHWIKKRSRGFNQSEELGRCISESLKIPMKSLLKRKRNTKPQIGLSGDERIKNIKGAFKVSLITQKLWRASGGSTFNFEGKTVILIDDVVTTGATVNECTKVLKKTGVREVIVLCLAIAG